jgi:hypothetical protein
MRALLALIALTSTLAHAGANLTLQGNQYAGRRGTYPMVGLSLNEKIVKGLRWNAWLGHGERPVEGGAVKDWTTGKLGLEYYLGNFMLGVGGFYNMGHVEADQFGQGDEFGGYAKVSYKLW